MSQREFPSVSFFVGNEIFDKTPYEDNRPPEDLGTCPICGATIGPKDRVCWIDILAGRLIHEDCGDHWLSLNQIFARLDLKDLLFTGRAGDMWQEGDIEI